MDRLKMLKEIITVVRAAYRLEEIELEPEREEFEDDYFNVVNILHSYDDNTIKIIYLRLFEKLNSSQIAEKVGVTQQAISYVFNKKMAELKAFLLKRSQPQMMKPPKKKYRTFPARLPTDFELRDILFLDSGDETEGNDYGSDREAVQKTQIGSIHTHTQWSRGGWYVGQTNDYTHLKGKSQDQVDKYLMEQVKKYHRNKKALEEAKKKDSKKV